MIELKDTESEIKPCVPCNWYTSEGSKQKVKALEKKGLPSFYNWRFITLTVDPVKFQNAESAYNYIKPRLRYFIREFKKQLKVKELQYIWKLEFQENDFPHWHLLVNYKSKIDIPHLTKIWGNGRIDCQRVKDKKLPYLFKYITKPNTDLPYWFLQFKRPRVFQSSNIFPKQYKDPDWDVSDKEEINEDTKEKKTSESLGQRLERYKHSIKITSFVNGTILRTQIYIRQTYGDFLHVCQTLSKEFRDNYYNFILPTKTLNQIIS